MPYIPKSQRQTAMEEPLTAGDLNYKLTRIAYNYLKKKGVSYASMNEVIGVLECMKLELYRRIAVPYENWKKEQNGDVYD